MEERLRKFAKVAESGSYTRAAKALHISQPALSTALHKLERELGATLIVRGKQSLTLTRAGKAAYAYAKELGVQNSNFQLRLSALVNEKPLIKIGMIDSIADALLATDEQLAALEAAVQVSLSVNNSRVLLRGLERDELDIVFIATPEQPLPRMLHATPLGSEPLIAVTTPGHVTAAKSALAQGSLPDFIGYDQQSHTNQLIRQYFVHMGVELQAAFYSTSPEIILHMVLSGRGTAVLPYKLVAGHLEQGTLRTITGPISRHITAVHSKNKLLPESVATLVQSVKNILVNQNADGANLK